MVARQREKRARAPQAGGEGSQRCAVEGGGLRGSSGGSRARVGLSKVFEIGAQALSMSRARAPTPTLTHERTCTMPRRHDRVALSTRVDARVDAL